MKRLFVIILSLIVGGIVAAGAYAMISPYHAQLRADFSNPSKRTEAIKKAIDFEKVHYRALKGDKDAEYKFGLYFMTGDLGFTNTTQALTWFRRAADKGHAYAQLAMGHAYLAGEGVEKDESEGALWIEKAAQANVPQAQDILGLLLAGAIGEPQDLTQGLNLLQRAQSSEARQVGADIDARFKEVYAIPRDQREQPLKDMEEAVKADVRARFPAIEKDIAKSGLVMPPAPVPASATAP